MTQAEIVRDLILTEPTWVEEDSYFAQVDMRQRCANIAALEIQRLEKTIAQQAAELKEAAELLEQADNRIGELKRQLAATLHATEATVSDGALYAEGCKP